MGSTFPNVSTWVFIFASGFYMCIFNHLYIHTLEASAEGNWWEHFKEQVSKWNLSWILICACHCSFWYFNTNSLTTVPWAPHDLNYVCSPDTTEGGEWFILIPVLQRGKKKQEMKCLPLEEVCCRTGIPLSSGKVKTFPIRLFVLWTTFHLYFSSNTYLFNFGWELVIKYK